MNPLPKQHLHNSTLKVGAKYFPNMKNYPEKTWNDLKDKLTSNTKT